MLNGTVTRSPTFSISTSEPFSIISPVISCPRIRPGGAVVRPRTMCWSDPQMFVVTTFRITPCGASLPPNGSVSLLGIRSFGYAIDCTSTAPGLMYATPRLLAMLEPPFSSPYYSGRRCCGSLPSRRGEQCLTIDLMFLPRIWQHCQRPPTRDVRQIIVEHFDEIVLLGASILEEIVQRKTKPVLAKAIEMKPEAL